jgi:predicted kinase
VNRYYLLLRGESMATLHLMIGLPCSGKTTYARALSIREKALLLTPDVWQLKLFGQDYPGPYHDKRHSDIEAIMWDVARSVLSLGTSVILDFGFWSRAERDDFRNRAKELGVDFKLHYRDVPYSELYRRLEERNQMLPEGVFKIPKEAMDQFISMFEPPVAEELI